MLPHQTSSKPRHGLRHDTGQRRRDDTGKQVGGEEKQGDASDVQVGDKLLQVAEQDVKGASLEQLMSLLLDSHGTWVALTFESSVNTQNLASNPVQTTSILFFEGPRTRCK